MTLDRKILDEEAWGDVCSLSPDALRERIALVRSELMPQVVETATRSDGFSAFCHNGSGHGHHVLVGGLR